MALHNQLGKEGEDAVAFHLQDKGYTIIERNYKFQRHEIDIIAQHGDTLVFIEVKTRSSDSFMKPYETVTEQQKRNIIFVANAYLKAKRIAPYLRFDILSVINKKGESAFHIEHIENAFTIRQRTYR